MRSPFAKRVDIANGMNEPSGFPSISDHSGSGAAGLAHGSVSLSELRPDPVVRCLVRFIDMAVAPPLAHFGLTWQRQRASSAPAPAR